VKQWKRWKYKHLTFVVLGIIPVIFLYQLEIFHSFLLQLGSWGYIGAFLAGILYISTYTVGTGIVILLILAEKLNHLELVFFAGLGSILGDYLIYKFVRDDISDEVGRLYKKFGGNHLNHLLHTKYFSWFLPVIGAIIIVSPFPDELGISLMGLSKMKTYQFILIAAILDFIGIFLVVSASNVIKP
jgi:uncharacterized membrane protein YdjX (TVP38/TMEM64 family)